MDKKESKFAKFVVKGRYWFLGIFFVLLVVSAVMMNFVNVNYDLTKYLPDDSSTKESIELMKDEFGSTGTADIMLTNVTQQEAQNVANKIADIGSVATSVLSRYQSKDDGSTTGYALISIFLTDGDYTTEAADTLDNIETLMSETLTEGQEYYLTGSAVTAVASRTAIMGQIPLIMAMAVLVVLIVLTFTTRSWIEPVILLIVIGTAILINMGTNYLLGEISFISNSVSSVLLIALAMDYSIVLVNRFREEREKEPDLHIAMQNTIRGSIVTILSSGLTVMAGLLSLVFMDYKIGLDMGLVLTKGVFISILAVIFLMPAILLLFSKALKKTEHKNFLKGLTKVGTFAKATRWVMPVLFLVIVIGACTVQSTMLDFNYVAKFSHEGDKVYEDEQTTAQIFGEQNTLVVMLSTKDADGNTTLTYAQQQQIFNDIKTLTAEGGKALANNDQASSFATSGSKGNPLTVEQIQNSFGFTTEQATAVFALTGNTYGYADGNNSTVYTCDLIKCLANNENIQATLSDAQKYVVNQLKSIQDGLFLSSALNTTQIQYGFGFTADQATQIMAITGSTYGYVNSDNLTVYACDLIKCLATNQDVQTALASAGATAEQLGQITTLYSQEQMAEKVYNSENYTRMIFNIDAVVDSDEAIDYVKALNNYLDTQTVATDLNTYIVNNTQNVIETTDVFKSDRLKVDLISAIAILIIVCLAFRSLSLPIVLVLVIEGSIWINLAGNALLGNSLYFICYLLGSAIQMGATIDYGILLSARYTEARRTQNKYDAIKTAIDKSFSTILSSGTILTLAALCIGIFSSVPLLSSIGYLIGFGAMCASLSILFVLPQVLLILDKPIAYTTLHSNFYFPEKASKDNNHDSKDENIVETTAVQATEKNNTTNSEQATTPQPAPKKRGKPKKVQNANVTNQPITTESTTDTQPKIKHGSSKNANIKSTNVKKATTKKTTKTTAKKKTNKTKTSKAVK